MARRRRNQRTRPAPDRSRYRRLRSPFRPFEVLSADQVDHLHTSAVRYLADEGMRVLFPEARDLLVAAGCTPGDDLMIRFDPDVVADAIATAPSTFDLHAPNPDRAQTVGGDNVVLAPVGGPPFVSDRLRGRRPGTLADQQNFLRLTQHYDVLAVSTPSVEPGDVPIDVRHLQSFHSTITLTDKPPWIYARGRQRARDNFDMLKIRMGMTSDDELAATPCAYTIINTNSPRQLDVPMATAIIDFARLGQPVIMTPFTLAGAMAPVTLAGALVLQHMEAVAAITLAQVVRPGAPVLYGAFTSNVDMRSGSPAFGTPESFRAALASGQLARHIGVPWRSSASSASNAVDAQAGYETMMNTFGAICAGTNWLHHAAGWEEGGLTASYEKFVVDIEMCQMLAESFQPVPFDDADLALDAISEVGPGGHFFGAGHTLERYETAFYESALFTRQNYEQWEEAGSKMTDERATEVWQRVLADFEPPPLDDAIAAELDGFVARRTAEGGAAPD
ncbi:MAG: trimethylamine methyltransferase family protein [Actinomycetota bacterium]